MLSGGRNGQAPLFIGGISITHHLVLKEGRRKKKPSFGVFSVGLTQYTVDHVNILVFNMCDICVDMICKRTHTQTH